MADRFKPCSIPNCKGNSHWSVKGAGSLCRNHVRRKKLYGDPQEGRAMNGAPLEFFENVVLSYEGDDCLIWPFARSYGYGSIRLDGKAVSVSRVVCERVHGPAPSDLHETAHNCGKGSEGCVAPTHVRWATPTENHADKVIHETDNRGERCGTSKLTREKVREIRNLRGKMTQKEIATIYGVNYITIGDIHNRRTWAWLE